MTEVEAEKIFEIVEDKVIEIVKDTSWFKFLALRKRGDNFYFKLQFDSTKLNGANPTLLQYKLQELLNPISIEQTQGMTALEIISEPSNSSFRFYGCKLFKLFKKKKYNKVSKSITVQSGQVISNNYTGTLGAILKLNNEGKYYALSNYHVIMGDNGKIGDEIKGIGDKKIGSLFWGKYDETHDVALAEISEKLVNVSSGVENLYDFGKIIKPTFKMNRNLTFTEKKGPSDGEIYSTKAIVRIENDLFKDQIIYKNFNLSHGHSGSVIVNDGNRDEKDIVGICMGGDQVLDVVNKLITLFQPVIHSFIDEKGRKMPQINFKSFY